MPRITTVLFDLDGTLVDTIALILASVRHAFAGRDRAPTDADWLAGIGTPLRSQLRAFVATDADLEAVVERYRAYQREHHDRSTRCYDGALDTVAALHRAGRRIGVVTAKLREPADRALRHVGLAPYVGALVGADDVARSKPDPEPVRLALARLGADPAEAVFVGDSPHDVAAGNAAGVATIAAHWGACSREALAAARPVYDLDRIEALPQLLSRIERAPGLAGPAGAPHEGGR